MKNTLTVVQENLITIDAHNKITKGIQSTARNALLALLIYTPLQANAAPNNTPYTISNEEKANFDIITSIIQDIRGEHTTHSQQNNNKENNNLRETENKLLFLFLVLTATFGAAISFPLLGAHLHDTNEAISFEPSSPAA